MKYSAPAGDGEARRALGPAPIDHEVRAIGRLPAVRERFYAITVELSAAARTDMVVVRTPDVPALPAWDGPRR